MGSFVGDGIIKGRGVIVWEVLSGKESAKGEVLCMGGFVGDGISKGRGAVVREVLSGMDIASAVGVTLTW